MPRLLLFYRLMVRPLLREPVRAGLTVLAVALGVAVVLAIDLAGDAATGSFRSSMETLAGDNDLEITTPGGVPENLVGTLASLPYSIRISPRIEDYAVIAETRKSLPLIGLDLVAEGSGYAQLDSANAGDAPFPKILEDGFANSEGFDSIWVGASLGFKPGDHVQLLINDQVHEYSIRGVYPDSCSDAVWPSRSHPVEGAEDSEPGGVAAAFAFSTSRRRGIASARNGHERESPHAGRVSMEFATVELRFPRCWVLSHLQHDFRFRGSAAAGDWDRARAWRKPRRGSLCIRGGGRLLRNCGCVDRAAARPLHGGGGREVDGCHGRISLRQQPAGTNRVEFHFGSSGTGDWRWSCGCVGLLTGVRGFARFPRGGDGKRSARIRRARPQE